MELPVALSVASSLHRNPISRPVAAGQEGERVHSLPQHGTDGSPYPLTLRPAHPPPSSSPTPRCGILHSAAAPRSAPRTAPQHRGQLRRHRSLPTMDEWPRTSTSTKFNHEPPPPFSPSKFQRKEIERLPRLKWQRIDLVEVKAAVQAIDGLDFAQSRAKLLYFRGKDWVCVSA